MATTAAASPTSSTPGGSRPQAKVQNTVQNNTNNTRRNMQSPVDGGASLKEIILAYEGKASQKANSMYTNMELMITRRNSSHKAWGSPANYNNQQTKFQNSSNGNQKRLAETDTPDKHMHDRLVFLLGHCHGRQVTVTTKSGDLISGILGGVNTNSDLGCSLKFAKFVGSVHTKDDNLSQQYIGGGVNKAIVIEPKDLADIEVSNVALTDLETGNGQNGASNFKTDVDISGNQPTRERELRRWQPDEVPAGLGLEESMSGKPANGAWDQFAVNEKLFGVKSNFDELQYTTRIDTSHPQYKQREARAAKIAREIENGSTATLTAHQAEERNLAWGDDSGMDEEDKYSGVQRTPQAPLASGAPNKYTPPARRPQLAAPADPPVAVPNIPSDPAIISSQVSKPENTGQSGPAKTPSTMPIPSITKEAPSPQPPSVNSFKSEESKAREKPALPESVRKSVATPPIPAVPTMKPNEATVPNSSNLAVNPPLPNVIKGTRDSFKQFVNNEKEKYEKRRQALVRKDKDVKLQDLRKFAESFKLNTPVPPDLVPILAKDKVKQEEIVRKADQNAAATAVSVATKASTLPAQTPSGSNVASSSVANVMTSSSQPQSSANQPHTMPVIQQGQITIDKAGFNKPQSQRDRNVPYGQQHPGTFRDSRSIALPQNINLPTGPAQRPLSIRLMENQRLKQSGQYVPMQIPPPMPMIDPQPPTGPAATVGSTGSMASKPLSPTSMNNAKLNAKAFEFKPNPAAATFTPLSPSTHPEVIEPVEHHLPPRMHSPSAFFGTKKPRSISSRVSTRENFNPFKRSKELHAQDGTEHKSSSNSSRKNSGVYDKPYLTTPVWQVMDENQNKSYTTYFQKSEVIANEAIRSPQPRHNNLHMQHSNMNSHLPHAPSSAPHMPHHPQQNPMHHPHQSMQNPNGSQPHFGEPDHHLRQMTSPPAVMASPHLQNAAVAFGSPANSHALLYTGPQGQMQPQYNQSSQFQGYRGGYNGPQYMQPPVNGGPNPTGMVLGQHGQPQMPYMVPNMSGPYMQQGMPQGMYAPHQMHMYNAQPGVPLASSVGYPSPGRGAPMMMHQGSQQGQNGPMPTPMMMSMSNGPAGHLSHQQQMRPYPPPQQYPHHAQQPQHGFMPGQGGRGVASSNSQQNPSMQAHPVPTQQATILPQQTQALENEDGK